MFGNYGCEELEQLYNSLGGYVKLKGQTDALKHNGRTMIRIANYLEIYRRLISFMFEMRCNCLEAWESGMPEQVEGVRMQLI